MGLNISKSGISPSLRTRYGSIGSKGYSVRTGIRGLSYREGYRKGSDAGLIALVIFALVALIPFLIQVAVVAARILWAFMVWLVQVFVIASNLIGQGAQRLAGYMAGRQALAGSASQPALGAGFWAGISSAVLITLVFAVAILVHKLNAPTPRTQQAVPNQLLEENRPTTTAVNTRPRRQVATVSSDAHKQPHPPDQQAKAPGATVAASENEAAASQMPVAPDDLIEIRANDAQSADHIAAYCTQATASAADQVAATSACHRAETAAWKRLVLDNEFPTLDDAMRQKCKEPPFPDSYVALEACAKYLLNNK
jgi:hypothetical protein